MALNSNDEIFAGSRGHYYEYNGGVLRSSDNGETWTDLLTNILVTSIAIDSEDKIYIGCSDLDGAPAAVRFSDDNGESWDLIESVVMPSDIGIEFLTISEDDHIYAISYEPIRHVYRSTQPTTKKYNYELQISDFELKNYPNPFNPQTTISFETTNLNNDTRIEIYNVKGQKIKEFEILECVNRVNAKATRSHYSTTWDGTNYSGKPVNSGIYFYKLISGDQMIVKKAILVK